MGGFEGGRSGLKGGKRSLKEKWYEMRNSKKQQKKMK